MKKINLNESQFNRLFEASGDSPILDGTDSLEDPSLSQVSTQAEIQDPNGDDEMSDPINTNQFADMQTPQQWRNIAAGKLYNSL